jgi:RHS repeat-associated protein
VLGSASASVNLSGQVVASQLYSPYGSVRYQSGILPTDIGFTHQRADATKGLDDYGARWYDPLAGQFISADTLLPKSVAQPDPGQLNRYAYVVGNPESKTDPSGHYLSPPSGGGAQRLDPKPSRTNYYDDFVHDYWTDRWAGQGEYDDMFYNAVMATRRRTAEERANAAHEDTDGEVLAGYFGLTVRHIPVDRGPTGPIPTPDYMVEINTGLTISPLGPVGVADPAQPKYSTGIDLYTPNSHNWRTIVTAAYDKGEQASIVAIDIRGCYELQGRWIN